MTVGRISLVVFLAALMAVFSPGMLRMAMAGPVEQTAPVVPMGEELDETALLEVDGEFWWFWIGFVLAGGARAIYHNWFDGEPGISRDNVPDIMLAACVGGLALHWTASSLMVAKAVRDIMFGR